MTDVAVPPPRRTPQRAAWPAKPTDDLEGALVGLTTALHLAAAELRLTTEGVARLPDPRQRAASAPLVEAITLHIGFAAHGVERLLGLLTAEEKGNR